MTRSDALQGETHPAPAGSTPEEIAADPILRYFHYAHPPAHLRGVSHPFCFVDALWPGS